MHYGDGAFGAKRQHNIHIYTIYENGAETFSMPQEEHGANVHPNAPTVVSGLPPASLVATAGKKDDMRSKWLMPCSCRT